MRYSELFGKSVREVSEQVLSTAHRFLLQGGFLRESTAGRYFLLPLGMRVQAKICKIIEEEMDTLGAQQITLPVLHPSNLWEESGRNKSAAFELMKTKDRRGFEFVLGGTAEEMFCDLIRKFDLSYRELPVVLYQFSTKFRDELRVKGGLLRTREFLMKDAYSFHENEESFRAFYSRMLDSYSRIFDRLHLNAQIVEADNGYMGGEFCHEFVVENKLGESRYLVSEDGRVCAHEDIATFLREDKNLAEALLPAQEAAANRGPSIADGVALYGKPAWRQIKTIVYVLEDGERILVSLRGDLDVSEAKLRKVLGVPFLRMSSEVEVLELDSVVGFVSPLKLKLRKIGDLSLKTVRNFYTGADAFKRDTLNVNYGRDFTVDVLADIALASDGDISEGGSVLHEKKGIEVGNTFQLGSFYSDRMSGVSFTDSDGTKKGLYMGSYGIGVGRTLATIAEVHNDERGLVWPTNLAPFDVHLISLGKEKGVLSQTEEIYEELLRQEAQVLYDNRDTSAGVKFADADLLGIPNRLLVSRKTIEQGAVEHKLRGEAKTSMMPRNDLAIFRKH